MLLPGCGASPTSKLIASGEQHLSLSLSEHQRAPAAQVVVTGASGMIGQLLLPALREKYEVVALDIKASPGVQVCDLLGPRENIRPFFKGAYAVVHSGFVPPPKDVSIQASSFLAANLNDERLSDEDKAAAAAASGGLKPADRLFAAENSNVRMAFNVYQVATFMHTR